MAGSSTALGSMSSTSTGVGSTGSGSAHTNAGASASGSGAANGSTSGMGVIAAIGSTSLTPGTQASMTGSSAPPRSGTWASTGAVTGSGSGAGIVHSSADAAGSGSGSRDGAGSRGGCSWAGAGAAGQEPSPAISPGRGQPGSTIISTGVQSWMDGAAGGVGGAIGGVSITGERVREAAVSAIAAIGGVGSAAALRRRERPGERLSAGDEPAAARRLRLIIRNATSPSATMARRNVFTLCRPLRRACPFRPYRPLAAPLDLRAGRRSVRAVSRP